jgi:CRISPR-associated RAMP protein (TIGR02581 family)
MKIKVKITPKTPLLVASGKTFDVTRPDIEFVRINTGEGETVYIPGSSVKGVLRAGMEALLSEQNKKKPEVCSASDEMCHERYREKYKDRKGKKVPYESHCPVCRLFGSGDLAARMEISDVFPYEFEDSKEEKKKKIERMNRLMSSRSGIKIDRKTGKTVGGALFQYEILGGGELFGEFTFTNYELYQPGLLFTLFDLSSEGFLRYGHSKSRGLGVLDFSVEFMKIIQVGKAGENTIKGISAFEKCKDKDGFYMKEGDRIKIDGDAGYEDQVLYSTLTIDNKETIANVTKELKGRARALLA